MGRCTVLTLRWPWALYEAVNRTGSVDHDALRNKTTAHTQLAGILRTLTGKQTTAISGDEIKPDELSKSQEI
jgi:hypothetical protein